tara:strand:- start:661 stop:1524 length:864 start_codon:yes stop_codon:yes gene_type:complete
MTKIKLYNDDCFNHFKKVKEKSIDLFILDLPYNQTACNWDKDIIDLDKMWLEIKRIMKPAAVIVMFCTAKFGYRLIHSNPKWFKYDLIWKKSKKVGFLSANKMPLRQHELVYIFKEKQGTYNPQKTEGKPYTATRKNANIYSEKIKHKPTINKGDRHPTSIIENKDLGEIAGGYYRGEGKKPFKRMPTHPTERHPTSIIEEEPPENTFLEFNNPHKTIHRTQKPVDLLEWLIKTYSNEGDTVMDFCMGSGSCGIACMNIKRKFIGVEKDKEIFKLAKNRIESHQVVT